MCNLLRLAFAFAIALVASTVSGCGDTTTPPDQGVMMMDAFVHVRD